jgi:hypothetical protein
VPPTDFEIRAWAKAHDYELSDASPIPDSLRAAYDAAQVDGPDDVDEWASLEASASSAPPTPDGAHRSTPSPWSNASATPWDDPAWTSQPQGRDGFSIAALVLGILPVLAGLLGIIFGIIGINRTSGGRRSGRGMAISGVVLGSLWLVGIVVVLVVQASHQANRDENGAITTAGDVTATDLRIGDCLPKFKEGYSESVGVVPCSVPHAAEVYTNFDLTSVSYPGEKQAIRLAAGGCTKRLTAAVGATVARNTRYDVAYLYPTNESWARGDRGITCLIYQADESLRTGSLRIATNPG